MTAALPVDKRPATRADGFDVTAFASFAELAAAQASLREGESGVDLFATLAWFENLAATGIESDVQRLLLQVRQGPAGTAFCLPLLRRRRAESAPFGPVVTSLSNYYASLYAPIGDPRLPSIDALRAALSHLRRRHGPAAVIDLQPLSTEDPFYERIQAALRAEGYRTDSYFCFGNWYLQVAGRSYADYEPGIPSRIRNTIKRGRKKLDGAGAWVIDVQTTPGPALERAIADFVTIYGKSWKVPEPFPDFVPGLCRTAAAQGWLRLGVLRFEDQPIAAQLWLVKDRHALIYKLAYDEEYKRFSAGSVLSSELMRRALDVDAVVEVDYLTGDDAYKVDWMSHRRERRGVVAFHPRTLQGAAAWLKHRLGRWWRQRKPVPSAAAAAAAPVEDPA